MFGPYPENAPIRRIVWWAAALALILFSKLPGCFNLAGRLDVWRVEGVWLKD